MGIVVPVNEIIIILLDVLFPHPTFNIFAYHRQRTRPRYQAMPLNPQAKENYYTNDSTLSLYKKTRTNLRRKYFIHLSVSLYRTAKCF